MGLCPAPLFHIDFPTSTEVEIPMFCPTCQTRDALQNERSTQGVEIQTGEFQFLSTSIVCRSPDDLKSLWTSRAE
jgi:hypothetical protein